MDSPSKVAAESNQRLNIRLHPTSSANVTRQDKASERESSLSDSASTNSLSNTTGIDHDFRQRQITAINSRLYGNGCSRIGGASKAPSRGKQSNTASQGRYITGYNLNSTGTMVGVDGKSIGQKPNVSIVGCTASIKLRHPDPIKTSGTFSSSFTGYSLDSKHLKSSNKVPQSTSDFLSSALYRASYSSKNGSSQSNHTQGSLHNGPSNYSPNGQIGPRTDGYKMGEKSNTHYSFEALKESSRGPRSRKLHSLSCLKDENEHFGPRVRRDRYNRSDFQIIYDNAKFFIIKSYNEEDIHKSIKYDVWASTPNGNNKLNAAFHDVEAKYGEKGSKCPIFLFFSVNGSGQFLGIAEMVGPVDFEKTMDFWQQDKWSGFFPIMWHIIKDIPNTRLRHIILENNDCKPVTYTRDTQEVGLKQGLEMLSIFKNYVAVTSMLDDYKFYEDREKSLQVRKCIKEESPECDCRTAYLGNDEERSVKASQVSVRTKNTSDSYTSLASLARKLSLNDNNSRAGR